MLVAHALAAERARRGAVASLVSPTAPTRVFDEDDDEEDGAEV